MYCILLHKLILCFSCCFRHLISLVAILFLYLKIRLLIDTHYCILLHTYFHHLLKLLYDIFLLLLVLHFPFELFRLCFSFLTMYILLSHFLSLVVLLCFFLIHKLFHLLLVQLYNVLQLRFVLFLLKLFLLHLFLMRYLQIPFVLFRYIPMCILRHHLLLHMMCCIRLLLLLYYPMPRHRFLELEQSLFCLQLFHFLIRHFHCIQHSILFHLLLEQVYSMHQLLCLLHCQYPCILVLSSLLYFLVLIAHNYFVPIHRLFHLRP